MIRYSFAAVKPWLERQIQLSRGQACPWQPCGKKGHRLIRNYSSPWPEDRNDQMKERGCSNRTPMREATGHEKPCVPVDNVVEVSS